MFANGVGLKMMGDGILRMIKHGARFMKVCA